MCNFLNGNYTHSLACLFSFLSGTFLSSETLMRFDWYIRMSGEINQSLQAKSDPEDRFDDKFVEDNREALEKRIVRVLVSFLEQLPDDEWIAFAPVLALIREKRPRVMTEIDLPLPIRQTLPIKALRIVNWISPQGRNAMGLYQLLSSCINAQPLSILALSSLPGAFATHVTDVFDASFCADLEKVCTCVSDADFTQNKEQAIRKLLRAVAAIKPENAGKVHLALQVLPNRNRYARLIEAAIEELFFIGAHPDSRENFADHMAQYICTVDDTQLASVKYGVPEEFRRVKKLFL
ncbi:MAG: hypothetical protein J5974_00840 [Pyramidobacter sp.]|nr:hypothetical protein [Pyramidobacter sp.]